MSRELILVLDEGTSSTRAMLFDANGTPHGMAQQELTQHYPQAGWVEHDPREIWERTLACARAMVEKAAGAQRIVAIGISNQRETVVAWDRSTGDPLCNAIVWQDRRTAGMCARLRAAGHEEMVRARTGLLLDPYFSATKMRWLLDHQPKVAAAAQAGRLALGTVESWLAFKLTGNRAHITDAANASRTLLLPLDGADFDDGLCKMFGVPRAVLPQVVDNAGELAATDPSLFGKALLVAGMAGDQQAAAIGQGCLAPGQSKATYGTGAFILANQGANCPHSRHRLLGTVLHQVAGERHYALEGSIFAAGSLIQWLRDSLGLVETAGQSERLARSVGDNGGVVVIPAHGGLGAPHWLPDARGLITGLSFSTERAHIVRASLEAMAHQTRDLAEAFAADGAPWQCLRIDGGMAANDWMAQDIADLLDLTVTRPAFVETTALGAAMLAAVGCGLHGSLEQAAGAMIGATRDFAPHMDERTRQARLTGWNRALSRI